MGSNVPLAETFIETDWSRYTLANPNTTASQLGREPSADGATYPWGLSTLTHIDVRTFNAQSLGGLQVVEGTPEYWTLSGGAPVTTTFGSVASLNDWNALQLVATGTGSFVATSVTPQILDLTQVAGGLMQASYPSGNTMLNLANSYLQLSTDGFVTSASVPLSASTGGTDTLLIPIVEWTGIDLTQINGVRLNLTIGSTGTFYMTGLRVINSAYQPSSVIMDNWNGWLRQDIPLDGQKVELPVAANKQLPPVTYAASTGGSDDPMPINGTFSTVINVGSNTGTNSFTLNMRQVGGVDTSQLLIDGKTMLELSSGPQPGLTQTAEIARRISDFQGKPLSDFQGESMLDMDAIAEHVNASALQFQFNWGTNSSVIIQSTVETLGNPYQWNNLPTLTANNYYLVTFLAEENTVQAQVWSLNQKTLAPLALIWDSTQITDTYQFTRRPGRIGWQASFTDGACHVRSIRPSSLLFAEYQSTALASRTPVQSARLYATYSTDIQTLTGFTAATMGPNGVITSPNVSSDTVRTITGSSTKVFVNESEANQGIVSNVLSLDGFSGVTDWTETTISFSVWFPSASATQGPLAAYLVSDTGWYVPLSFPQINYDTWQQVTFDGPDIPPGLYQLQIVYTGTQQTTFWVDGASVNERAMTWDARANSNDAWTPFNGLVNSDSSGVMLNRGRSLQIRGQAHRQDSAISSKPKIVPGYAQLGKSVWPEDLQANPDPFTQPLATLATPLTSGSNYSTITLQPLTLSQVTALNYFQVPGRTLLTIQAPGGQQSTFFSSIIPTVGGTTFNVFDFQAQCNCPAGSIITGLGAPIWYHLTSGRTFQFAAGAQSSAGANFLFSYQSPGVNYITSWLWQLSDGTVLSGPNVNHTFSSTAVAGTSYDITLTTMDSYGSYSTNTIQIQVA